MRLAALSQHNGSVGSIRVMVPPYCGLSETTVVVVGFGPVVVGPVVVVVVLVDGPGPHDTMRRTMATRIPKARATRFVFNYSLLYPFYNLNNYNYFAMEKTRPLFHKYPPLIINTEIIYVNEDIIVIDNTIYDLPKISI